ncbi:MAG: GTPase Era [Christensenellales bacterium]|jgi:GTP-binding protein Era
MKTGFVAIIGRPNSGKSTLINALVGEKVAIVSWRPQTTRDRIIGVLNGEGFQAAFVDTPGLHHAQNKLGEYMVKSVDAALSDVDVVLYISDAVRGVSTEDIEFIESAAKKCGIVVAVNKIDSVMPSTLAEELVKLNGINELKAVVPISAKRGDNLEVLTKEIVKLLPEGEPMYPEDVLTDKSERFMCGEIIREKALTRLDKEIPFGLGIVINKFEKRIGKDIFDIDADIICERKSHKAIIIGKQGAMLKEIATEARLDIEKLIDCKVNLQLWVRVKEDWRDNNAILGELGYK